MASFVELSKTYPALQIFILFAASILAARMAYPLITLILVKVEKLLGPAFQNQIKNVSKAPYALLILCLVWNEVLSFLAIDEKWNKFLEQPFLIILGCTIIAISYQFINILSIYLENRLKSDHTNMRIHNSIITYSQRIIKVLIVVIVVLIILQNMGFNINSLIASLGIGGAAIALGAKETLGNLFGGISIIADKPFTVGDWIVCKDCEGTVEDIGFRSTKIKTFYDSVITLPNAILADSVIDNLGRRTARRTRFTLGVKYDTSPEKIESFAEGIREILKNNSVVRHDYFQVYFNGYGDFSLNILVNFFLKVSDWDSELSEKQKIFLEILKLSKKLDVEFAFPTTTLDLPSMPNFPKG